MWPKFISGLKYRLQKPHGNSAACMNRVLVFQISIPPYFKCQSLSLFWNNLLSDCVIRGRTTKSELQNSASSLFSMIYFTHIWESAIVYIRVPILACRFLNSMILWLYNLDIYLNHIVEYRAISSLSSSSNRNFNVWTSLAEFRYYINAEWFSGAPP